MKSCFGAVQLEVSAGVLWLLAVVIGCPRFSSSVWVTASQH